MTSLGLGLATLAVILSLVSPSSVSALVSQLEPHHAPAGANTTQAETPGNDKVGFSFTFTYLDKISKNLRI